MVAKEYHMPSFTTFNDLLIGDNTLVCDDIHMLDIKPTAQFPLDNFIGPIYGSINNNNTVCINKSITKFMEESEKSIVLSMGQGCKNKFFIKLLNCLSKTDFHILAIHTKYLRKENLPDTTDNILLTTFISPMIEILRKADISIIHGGRGTTYTAAYAGKPVIGIPMFFEHQYNIDNLVRKGTALRISKKFFRCEDLVSAINKIFNNYSQYLKNSQELANILTQEPGEKKAVDRLIEFTS